MRTTSHARGSAWAVLAGTVACTHVVESPRVHERGSAAPRGPELTAGRFHSCAIRCGGRVWCWGSALYLGQPDDAEQQFPVEVPIFGARSVVAGADRTCAIVGDEGTIACWGPLPPRGGADPRLPRSRGLSPAEVGVETATELSLGPRDSCAIVGSGDEPRAVCWGHDTGVGMELRPGFYEPTAPVEHFSSSHWGRCAQRGTALECWTDVPSLEGVDQLAEEHPITERLALGPRGSCRVTAERRVVCSRGPGRGAVVDDPRLADVVSVHAGLEGFCSLDAQGAVYCWDLSGDGGELEVRRVPFEHPVRAIALGFTHGCGVTTRDELLCWGSNRYGQLGDGTVDDSASPVPVVLPERCS